MDLQFIDHEFKFASNISLFLWDHCSAPPTYLLRINDRSYGIVIWEWFSVLEMNSSLTYFTAWKESWACSLKIPLWFGQDLHIYLLWKFLISSSWNKNLFAFATILNIGTNLWPFSGASLVKVLLMIVSVLILFVPSTKDR